MSFLHLLAFIKLYFFDAEIEKNTSTISMLKRQTTTNDQIVKAVYWWYYLIYFLRGFLGYQIDRYIWIDSNDRINAICKKLEIVRLFNDIKFIKDILNCKGCKSLG